ncbi:hypothetical protein Tco_1530028, partial [Tanacetum coccineum]
SCGNGARIGYNCPLKASIISNPEQCNQTINELPQTLPSVHPTCNSGDDNSFTYDSKPNFVDDSPNIFNPPPQPSLNSCSSNIHPHPQETSKEILQAQEDLMEAIQAFLKEYDHIPLNEKCMALLLAEERFLKIKQTIQQEKKETAAQGFIPYWNFSMIDDEEARDNFLKDSPSSFPIPVVDSDSFLEESDTSLSHLENSLPEFETFSNHTEETRSGSTTTHANYSLPEYHSFLF